MLPLILIFAAGMLVGGIAIIPWRCSARLSRLAIHRRAAGSMGASEWRIFWRIVLPGFWIQITLGLLLTLASAALLLLAVA